MDPEARAAAERELRKKDRQARAVHTAVHIALSKVCLDRIMK